MAENTLAQNINQAVADFADIKTAIEAKGVTVASGTPTSDYADLIALIPDGGSADFESLITRTATSLETDVEKLGDYALYEYQTLLSFSAPNLSEIGEYSMYNCRFISDIGTLKVSKIGRYGAYALAASTASGFRYVPESPAVVGSYGLAGAKVTEIVGEIKSVGANGLDNLGNQFTEFSGKFTGAIGNYGFSNNRKLKTVDFSDSTISEIGSNAFYYLGWDRANYASDPYLELDFRASKFKALNQRSFGYLRYTNIYLPSAVSQISAYAFDNCQNVNIFMSGAAPTLASTSAFQNASGFKIFVPWKYVAGYANGTNWSSLVSNIIGFAPAGTFTAGAALPAYNAEGYALTWYCDEAKTTQVTACPAGSPALYCESGASKVKQIVEISEQGNPTLTVADGGGNPVDFSFGFIACGNGDTLSLSVSPTQQGDLVHITVDGVKITSFPYLLTVGASDVKVKAVRFNPDEFTPVDYLEVQNNPSYIRTSIIPQQGSVYNIKAVAKSVGSSESTYSGWNYGGLFGWIYNNKWDDGSGGTSNGTSASLKTEIDMTVSLAQNTTQIVYKNAQGEITQSRSNSVLSYCGGAGYALFANIQSNLVTPSKGLRIYSGFKMYKDGNLILELLTLLDENGRPCMYDTVSGEWFYSETADDFLYGYE